MQRLTKEIYHCVQLQTMLAGQRFFLTYCGGSYRRLASFTTGCTPWEAFYKDWTVNRKILQLLSSMGPTYSSCWNMNHYADEAYSDCTNTNTQDKMEEKYPTFPLLSHQPAISGVRGERGWYSMSNTEFFPLTCNPLKKRWQKHNISARCSCLNGKR